MQRIRIGAAFFAVTVGFFSVVGCTKKETAVGAKTPRVGFVLATMNEERYQKDREYFLDAAKKRGVTVEFAACDDQATVQASKVEALLAKGIDVLVIQPVHGEAAASVVATAKRDGVKVVAYDRLIKNADVDWYVTQDSFQVGVLQAEAAVAATGGKGNYLLLQGEAGHSVAEEITRGVKSVIGKYPGVQIVVEQPHPGWSTSLALATTENALTRYKNKIDAILANNDGMALGAVRALEEQKLVGKVFVAGADADLTAVRDVVRGRRAMTVLKGIRPLAESALDVAVELASGKTPKSDTTTDNGKRAVPTTNTPVVPVTKSAVDSAVVGSGFHTREAVYGVAG